MENRTYISTPSQSEAGPTNNWVAPDELKATMKDLYKGCMKGRTMYVIPFSMGPIDSPIAKIGIEITDSPYVVCNMHIMTRVGKKVLESWGRKANSFPACIPSAHRLRKDRKMFPGPARLSRKNISAIFRMKI